jgi:hypothetical protein
MEKESTFKPKAQYFTGEFEDFLDRTHKFVIAAYSKMVNGEKVLSLGVSITHPDDKYNEGLGKSLALNRAKKNSNYYAKVSHPGMINYDVVQTLLEHEALYISTHPGKYIKGYEAFKKRYMKRVYKIFLFKKLTKEERSFIELRNKLMENPSRELREYLNYEKS